MGNDRKETAAKRHVTGLTEAHLALAQQLAHVGSWELDLTNLRDLDANPLYWSDETFRLLGYSPGEVEPSNDLFFRAVHPDDREKIRQAVSRAIQDQIPYNIEHRVIWPDGTQRILHEQSMIVYDDHGKPRKMLGVVQDITHRKKSHAYLELQSLILRNLADSVIATDLEGRVIYWNEGAQALYGYSPAEVTGHSLALIYPTGETTDLSTSIRLVLSGQDVRGEREGLRKDSRRVWVEVYTTVLRDVEGRPIGLLRTDKNISQKKASEAAVRHSEQLYRAVGESIDFGVWVCDPKGRLTHLSASFSKLLGLTREQNLSDGWRNALHPDERDAIMQDWRSCLAEGKVWNRRYRVRGADGQYHLVLTHGAPVRDENGEILCWAGLNLDVNNLK